MYQHCWLHPAPARSSQTKDRSVPIASLQHKLKISRANPIGMEHMLREELKARHERIFKEYGYHQW